MTQSGKISRAKLSKKKAHRKVSSYARFVGKHMKADKSRVSQQTKMKHAAAAWRKLHPKTKKSASRKSKKSLSRKSKSRKSKKSKKSRRSHH